MEEILKIGVVDDDEIKVTQIITRLIQGIDDATPEKRARYSQYQFVPIEVNLKDNLEEMIKHILELELDCLLIDYKL
ncbi:hypothetical protein GNF83_20490, partial [Clostridium perfringens]|nr:hypothetical protein [Clostridium perfringens]